MLSFEELLETTKQAIEAAWVAELRKRYGAESDITVTINLQDGSISATCNGESVEPREFLGRDPEEFKQFIIEKLENQLPDE